MATLYVSYYGAVDNQCASLPLGSEAVTTSATSAQANGNASAAVVMVFSDTAHYVTFGSNPTATMGTGAFIPANTPFWLDNTGAKLAAITA